MKPLLDTNDGKYHQRAAIMPSWKCILAFLLVTIPTVVARPSSLPYSLGVRDSLMIAHSFHGNPAFGPAGGMVGFVNAIRYWSSSLSFSTLVPYLLTLIQFFFISMELPTHVTLNFPLPHWTRMRIGSLILERPLA